MIEFLKEGLKVKPENNLEIAENIYYVGVDDRKNHLFENLWPVPNGISYNAYLIKDEKIALIEGGVKIDFERQFFENLRKIIDISKIDYIVVNHMEPDHTGTLQTLFKLAPNSKIVITSMGKKMLKDFYNIDDTERIIVVTDGYKISLGKTELEFYATPSVHWPETMMTYEKTNKILFSGDVFGSFGALNGKIFDYETDVDSLLSEAKRYYVNIVGKYTKPTLNAINKVSGLEIDIIAPAHGPVWTKYREKILSYYEDLANLKTEKNKVSIVYGTMYGFLEDLVFQLARTLTRAGANVHIFNIVNTHPSYVISEIWDSEVVLFGAPTYDAGPFPPLFYTVHLLERKSIRNKKFGLFGSSGWSGMGYKLVKDTLEKLNWSLIGPIIEIKGRMKDEDKTKVQELVNKISEAIKKE